MPSSQRNIKSLEFICCIPDIKHYMHEKKKYVFQYHIFTVIQYPELSRHTFVTMFSCNNKYCCFFFVFFFSNSMSVSSVTLFLTRKNIRIFCRVTLLNINFITYVYYVSKLQWLLCWKLHSFINNQKLDSISACCFCSFYRFFQLYCCFMSSLSRYLKCSLCLKFGNTCVFCHFLFSLHTIIS